ncbi:MAG TPA: hypothetical protein VN809_02595 [Telmatospirillum sp.]|nr:hypothetical protein [Telmatospirillum sp.]
MTAFAAVVCQMPDNCREGSKEKAGEMLGHPGEIFSRNASVTGGVIRFVVFATSLFGERGDLVEVHRVIDVIGLLSDDGDFLHIFGRGRPDEEQARTAPEGEARIA